MSWTRTAHLARAGLAAALLAPLALVVSAPVALADPAPQPAPTPQASATAEAALAQQPSEPRLGKASEPSPTTSPKTRQESEVGTGGQSGKAPAPKPLATTSAPAPKQTTPATTAPPTQPPAPGRWVWQARGWRYLQADGTPVAGTVKEIAGVRYAFDSTGYLAQGWFKASDGLWYVSTDQGVLTGWYRYGGSWYFLQNNGVMATGWVEHSGQWYYLSPTGAMRTGWVQHASGRWYHLSPSGAMSVSTWVRDRGQWYYLRSDGAMAQGWQQVGGTWYYLRPSSGAMASGWVQTGGRWYHLGAGGALTYGWLKHADGHWYYLDPAQGAAMVSGGWQVVEGQRSYFDPWSGFWVTSRASFQSDWNYAKGLYSPTGYLLTVNTSAPHCMAFYWRAGAWQPLWDKPCSVGKPSTPTVRGQFGVGLRGRSFGHGYTAYWWTQFHGDYLFHSILYQEGTHQVLDGRLGEHVSAGCVRMRIEDAKWIYDNVPSSTKVAVY